MKVRRSITRYVITLHEEVDLDLSRINTRPVKEYWEYGIVFSLHIFLFLIVFINVLGFSVWEFLVFFLSFALSYAGITFGKVAGPVVLIALMVVVFFINISMVFSAFNGFILSFVADTLTKFKQPYITQDGEVIAFISLYR